LKFKKSPLPKDIPLKEKIASFFKEALISHKQGQLEDAANKYREILNINAKNIDALHLLGVIQLQEKQWEKAEKLITESLNINPNQPAALNNLGIVYKEQKKYSLAIEVYKSSLNLKSDDANTYMNLGNVYHEIRDYELALKVYDKSLVLQPGLAAALINRALSLSQLGHHLNAIENYKLALHISPTDFNIYNNLGNSQKELGRLDLALECFSKSIQINAYFADAFFNKGNILRSMGKLHEALDSYNCAIELNTSSPEQYLNKGNLLHELHNYVGAIKNFNIAIHLKPDYSQAYNNLGNVYLDQKKIQSAKLSYIHAITLDPQYAPAYNNRATALRAEGNINEVKKNYLRSVLIDDRYSDARNNLGVLALESLEVKEAIDHFDIAIDLNKNFSDAHYNKANALREIKLFSQAIAHYERVLTLNSEYPFVLGLLIHSKMQICDWSPIAINLSNDSKKHIFFDDLIDKLKSDLEEEKKVTPPFPVLGLIDSPSLQLKAAKVWSEDKFPEMDTLGPIAKRDFDSSLFESTQPNSKTLFKKIRIGYFSADFRDHPVSYLMADIFEHHDRLHFEIFAFSLGPIKNDSMRARLVSSFDSWLDVISLSDAQIASKSRDLGIDIAVDLGGFTNYARSGIFALRVAPIQISYIGYLGTMGTSYIDYLIADKTIISPEFRKFYSEKIAYLPVYQANDSKRKMSDEPISRADLGIPLESFVYCCFNTNYKITFQTFKCWINILQKVPHGVLLLYADTPEVIPKLKRQAQNLGLDPSRIYFVDRVDQMEYLKRYTLADLFLDTEPYNAGTTASDALWSGLPVLTKIGKSFASRIAASLLKALDLDELIAQSRSQYEEIAVELGLNQEKAKALRVKLKDRKTNSDLFNTPKFTKNLERLFEEMIRRDTLGKGREDIEILQN